MISILGLFLLFKDRLFLNCFFISYGKLIICSSFKFISNGRNYQMDQAKIIFTTDEQIINNDQLKRFMENSSRSFETTLYDDELLVIVKYVSTEKQSYEKVRMLAGDISRDLGKRKVKNAHIDEKQLTEALSSLEDDQVIIAFVEGWNLGSYKFVNYLA